MTKWLKLSIALLFSSTLFSQVKMPDGRRLENKPVDWTKTAIGQKPDSIVHYYFNDAPGNQEKDFPYQTEISNYFDNQITPRVSRIDSIYPFRHTYKKDNSLNIFGNLIPLDSCNYTQVNRCIAIYRDFVICYKDGKALQYWAICTTCDKIMSIPKSQKINCLSNNDKFMMFISLYSRGYDLFEEKFRWE
jgi:hypothetical protein